MTGAKTGVAIAALLAVFPVKGDVIADTVLRLGMREDAPPFSALVEGADPATAAFDEAYSGFSVSLCSEVVQTLRAHKKTMQVEHVGVSAQTRFPSKERKAETWDLLCDSTSMTIARFDWCAFSFPFFVTGITYATRNPEAKTEDLAGQSAALVGATTADNGLRAEWERRHGTAPAFESFDDYETAVAAFAAGKVEAVFGDQVLLQEALTEAGVDVKLSSDMLSIELYGFCVAPGRHDVLAAVNATLARLYTNGEIYKILGRDFDGRGASRLLRSLYRLHAVAEE